MVFWNRFVFLRASPSWVAQAAWPDGAWPALSRWVLVSRLSPWPSGRLTAAPLEEGRVLAAHRG